MNDTKERTYTTRDKPAERGITVTNILLGLLLSGCSIFGVFASIVLDDMVDAVNQLQTTMTDIKIAVTVNESDIGHFIERFQHIEDEHDKLRDRVTDLERGL